LAILSKSEVSANRRLLGVGLPEEPVSDGEFLEMVCRETSGDREERNVR